MTTESEALPNGKQLASVLCRYLSDHSARRLNFLYWNITDSKDGVLCFVNLTGKELNRINNSDLAFRVVKVKKTEDWSIIRRFIDEYIVDETDKKAVYVIRIDYLLRYLKRLNFDLNRFKLERKGFGTAYSVEEIIEGEPKQQEPIPIATLDNDIQSLYLIDRLFNKYRKIIRLNESAKADIPNLSIEDITEDYMKSSEYRYEIKDLGLTVPIQESVDAISKKFVTDEANADPSGKIDQIYLNDGITSMVNRFTNSSMVVLSTRVYLQYFLSIIKSKRKAK